MIVGLLLLYIGIKLGFPFGYDVICVGYTLIHGAIFVGKFMEAGNAE